LKDEIAQQKGRYRKSELLALVTRSGMQIERQYYFNYLLLLPIWFGRRLIRWLGTSLKSEAEVNSPAVNQLLSFVFTADTITAPALHPPFGVSALVLARKAPLHE
jgi:hypothetical protein